MTRVVKSFNGAGSLVFADGELLHGRYHVDVRFLPVRRIEEAQGGFTLDKPPAWDSVVEARFAGAARLIMEDGRDVAVALGGIVGRDVAITSMQASPPA